MDWDRVIYNGTVVNDDGMQRADIYIRDGRVAAVTSERLPGTVGETTDASGAWLWAMPILPACPLWRRPAAWPSNSSGATRWTAGTTA